MGKELTLSKNQRKKKLTKEMFGWSVFKVTNEVSVFFNTSNENKSSILVSVPKKAVKEAHKRNLLKRRVKEVFRLNAKREKSVDYLVRFNKFVEGFESNLEDFLKETNSNIAKKILDNYKEEILNFKQICPIEMLDKLDNPITLKNTIKKVS